MKKIILTLVSAVLLILANTNVLFAQDVKVFWGKENPLGLRRMPALLAKRGDNVLGYKTRNRDITMVKYGYKDLQIKNEYPLIGSASKGAKTIDKDYSFEQFVVLKNKMYVGVSSYNRKTDLNTFFMQQIDDSGKLQGGLKKTSEISATSRRNRGAFDVYPSNDSTKILIVNNPPFEKYAAEKFGFKILDEELNEVKNLQVQFPYKDKYFSVSDYILSNDGNIYLLSKIELEKKEKQKEEAGYYYEIISISPEGEGKVKEYKIALPQKYITDVSYNDDGKYLVCSGFYNNIELKGRSRDEINGVFYLRINKETQEIESKGIKELDKDFIAELTSAKKANKGRGIASTFKLKNFIAKDDGGAVLVAENAYDYIVQVCTTDPKTGATRCRYDHHYVSNNIIAININPDGSIKWYTNIPKYQHTVNDGGVYISYMLSTAKNKIFIVYNDNPKNLDPEKVKTIKDIRPLKNPTKSVATLVVLSEDGKFEKKMLFSNKENKTVLLPSFYKQVNDTEFIVPAMNRGIYCCFIPIKPGKYRLARFTFE